ncbi:unnamed protein product, partial [Porites evermanni]
MQKELTKILRTYRARPHQISGKSPGMLLFNLEIRTKVPHINSNSNTAASALDRDHRSKCSFVGDVMFCANIKPNKLDSKFSLAKHVIIETKARDKFSLVNVDKGTTLVRHAKYLKHAA